MNISMWRIVCAIFLGLLMSGKALALTLEEVPKPVRHTIEKEAKGGPIGPISQSGEGEKSEFSTIIQPEGKSFSITVGHHGRLLHKEKVSIAEVVKVADKEKKVAKKDEHIVKKEEKTVEKKDEKKGTSKAGSGEKGASNGGAGQPK